MGAQQSVGRPSNNSRSIPARPRTPLRFGSVPTPLPVDPAEYNTRPVRHLYQYNGYGDSVTSILSQESYFDMSASISSTLDPSSPSSTEGCSSSPSSSEASSPASPSKRSLGKRRRVDSDESPNVHPPYGKRRPSHRRNSTLLQQRQSNPYQPVQQCSCLDCVRRNSSYLASPYLIPYQPSPRELMPPPPPPIPLSPTYAQPNHGFVTRHYGYAMEPPSPTYYIS